MAIVIVLSLLFVVAYGQTTSPYPEKEPKTAYDYVIVGAGTAGSVVANRLSEIEGWSVLVLEAGHMPPIINEISLYVEDLEETDMHWADFTEPQKNACLAFPQQRCDWSRAKALGGASSHNHQIYTRGNQRDYDEWERMGNVGWGWKDVLKYFKRSENNMDPKLNNSELHGRHGPMNVAPANFPTKIGDAYIEAAKSMGLDYLEDVNGDNYIGVGRLQATQRDGRRCASEKAFLRPSAQRKNLDIVVDAYVLKIDFNEHKRAEKVIFDHKRQTKWVRANREIILCAGALSSPQILLLSGVGPKEQLEEFKIPAVSYLPVGENLQDHPMAKVMNFKVNSTVGLVYPRDLTKHAIAELVFGKGPLTSTGYLEILLYANTTSNGTSAKYPDILIQAGPSTIDHRADGTCPFSILLKPKSTGYLKLRSTNPYDNPVVDPQYLTVEEDAKALARGLVLIHKIMTSQAFAQYNPELLSNPAPACGRYEPENFDYWVCAARQYTSGGKQYSGTCKMGPTTDRTAVVDPHLRVIGVKDLRVADASIMPQTPSSNINAPCVMIGEKLAHMIKTEQP